ncbi:MAG: hypothetical protein OXC62_05820, partial [Aestuariivita sp.]|nr:hypothetical protein [Aestuariivita sp.]
SVKAERARSISKLPEVSLFAGFLNNSHESKWVILSTCVEVTWAVRPRNLVYSGLSQKFNTGFVAVLGKIPARPEAKATSLCMRIVGLKATRELV